MHWTVSKQQTLLEALQEKYPESSKTTLRSWVTEGRVWVGDIQVRLPQKEVHPQDVLSLDKKKQYLWNGIEILYQDQELIVIYKPAGLLSVATDDGVEDHAQSCLQRTFRRRTLYPVHRIDRDVSGILLFTFTKASQEILKEQFAEHTITREYLAIVEGILPRDQGSWESYLREEENLYVHSVRDPSRGKLAITHYEVLARTGASTVLRVRLETGRKNQIRVHAAEAGFPIVGDKKYGSTREFHGRVALQACLLQIAHPTKMKPLKFSRRPDDEFSPFLQGIRLDDLSSL
ncbi:MAG: RluA family pseudouridine synthase [Chlamydiae bacterium]|nr:RluA family pseudouridine synthase [Chlamydiota bacterium]